MKKYLVRTLTIASLASALLGSNFAFAQSNKAAAQSKNIEQPSEDPDLKLSIEELKKKYPISWFDKKYGDYNCCESNDCTPDPKRVCGFTSDPKEALKLDGVGSILLFDPLEKLNEAQLKSVIIFYNKKSEYDVRPDHLLLLILKRIDDVKNQTPLIGKIRNFFYSDNVLGSYEDLSCEVLANFDPNNKYYEKLAVGYFKAVYKSAILSHNPISNYSFNSFLNRCISSSKRDSVKIKFTNEFKPKFK